MTLSNLSYLLLPLILLLDVCVVKRMNALVGLDVELVYMINYILWYMLRGCLLIQEGMNAILGVVLM